VFERYTERARRVLFFARYECSVLGSPSIETEHLLLGLVREGKGITARILQRAQTSLDALRDEVKTRSVFKEQFPTSVEIPFSQEVKRILQYTAEEADRLEHSYIGTEHILLALLRDTASVAGSILDAHGLRHDEVRKQLLEMLQERPASSGHATRGVSDRIVAIKPLVMELSRTPPETEESDALVQRIFRELDGLANDTAGLISM
jgi:ATP-dependent Clp protease ATP-binding subunit ClpC